MLPANSAFVNLRRLLAKGPAAGGTLTRTISACPPDHSKFAAPLLNKPTPAREIGGCPPEYSRMAARVHKCNTKLPHVSASYSDEELMANIWTRAIARNGRPSRHRCAAPVAHSPLTRSAHPRTTHPLARSPAHPLTRSAQGARRLLREVWHDRLHELVVRNDVGRDHEHPAHSASVQRRRLGVWRVRRAAASLLVPGCVLCVSCFCRMPYPRA